MIKIKFNTLHYFNKEKNLIHDITKISPKGWQIRLNPLQINKTFFIRNTREDWYPLRVSHEGTKINTTKLSIPRAFAFALSQRTFVYSSCSSRKYFSSSHFPSIHYNTQKLLFVKRWISFGFWGLMYEGML
jgi:hypothetical protein